jgi:hypothetical protein
MNFLVIRLELDFGTIKKLYRGFMRHAGKYPKVIINGGGTMRHYELKWGPLNQRPIMELVAAEMIKEYRDDAERILGREI